MFVSIIFVALFAQALSAQAPTPVAESSANDVFFELMEAGFQESHPEIYKIVESFRVLFGIPKEKMREFSLKAVETFSNLQELWEKLTDLFMKEKKAQETMNPDHINMIPNKEQQNYRSY